MKKKTKPGAIQQLLSYAGNNKKQLYLSTFLATLGELFGMAPFITVSLLVAELFNKTATIQNVCILFAVALGGQILKLWLTYQSSFMSHKTTYKILKNIRSKIADKMLRVPMGIMLDTPTGNFKNLMADTVSKLEDSMAHFMPEITSNVVAPLCCILLVFILDWRMGLAALITIPLGLLGYIGMMNDYVNKSTTYMKSQNAMNSTLPPCQSTVMVEAELALVSSHSGCNADNIVGNASDWRMALYDWNITIIRFYHLHYPSYWIYCPAYASRKIF